MKRNDGRFGAYKSKRDRDFNPDRAARNKNRGPAQTMTKIDKAPALGSFTFKELFGNSYKYYYGQDPFKYTPKPPPPPVKYPTTLAELKGRDVHVTLTNMPGGLQALARWSGVEGGWQIDAELPEVTHQAYGHRLDQGLQHGKVLLTTEEVYKRTMDSGYSALRVIAEEIRRVCVFLITHELDECLKVGGGDGRPGLRVRNPHRYSFDYETYGDHTALDTRKEG